MIIDGTYLADHGLLIAIDEHLTPLAWQWCSTESEASWTGLLQQIPAPLVVVCDGGTGSHAALAKVWPDTLVQRCIFHIWMNLRTHLTLHPRTPAGKALLELGRHLRRVSSIDEASRWLQLVNDWFLAYGALTRQRSYARKRADGSWDSPNGKRWWYTHDRLRKAYNLIANVIRKRHLFTYLEVGCPKTTSQLEGGINAAIKLCLRLHRGMSEQHQMRAAEWVLIQRAKLLSMAHSFPIMPTASEIARRRPRFNEPEPGPALYDRGITAAEGLWARSGWAGRG